MKKLIVLLMFVLSYSLAAQNYFAVEMGWLPNADTVRYADLAVLTANPNIMYASLEVNFDFFDYFFVGGNVNTFILPSTDSISFYPFYASYTVDLGLRFRDFKLGYQHTCNHPIYALSYLVDAPLYSTESSYDKVYLRLEKKF